MSKANDNNNIRENIPWKEISTKQDHYQVNSISGGFRTVTKIYQAFCLFSKNTRAESEVFERKQLRKFWKTSMKGSTVDLV